MERDDKTEKKQFLRKKFLELREKLSDIEVKEKSSKVIERLVELEKFKLSKNILIYYPFKKEIDTLELLKYKNKNFYFPVIDFEHKELLIRKYNGKFVKNKFGIYEPTKLENDGDIDSLEIIDFILVPGIVFDKRCFRIGYGGGYYDRLLKKAKSFSCGICYDFQIIDFLPVEEYDVRVSCVLSENFFIQV
ncbi:MAG: 5-formyltetrahydrofolate cyclo-ligase [Elusimicrobiota bacterium]|nr:5-formyltetrahydrofolate cyclo-ligase [Endomicrobiia bacterium]MCX7910698.1 5-formyltetrahydrofolate cyclo-ligase [Endomicrobiia bacterium]MDW8164907.1 5-formyltetrahydrofolate cyclo-ligase [Elusimicrobiota bacterium]